MPCGSHRTWGRRAAPELQSLASDPRSEIEDSGPDFEGLALDLGCRCEDQSLPRKLEELGAFDEDFVPGDPNHIVQVTSIP